MTKWCFFVICRIYGVHFTMRINGLSVNIKASVKFAPSATDNIALYCDTEFRSVFQQLI